MKGTTSSILVALVLAGCGLDSTVPVTKSTTGGITLQPISVNQRYAVKMKDVAKGKAALQAAGGQVVLELKKRNVVAAKMSAQAAAALAKNPNIQYVEADPVRRPLSLWNDDSGDPKLTEITPYGIKMVEADQLAQTAAATNVTVCIIDSGYYAAHDDLRNLTGDGVTVVGYSGVADTDNDPATDPDKDWYSDKDSHGSHVAGTISAINNGLGVVGVLPKGVNLAIVKVFGDDGIWGFFPYLSSDPAYGTELAAAVDKCVELRDGIDPTQPLVISMSLGGASPSDVEEQALIDAHTLHNALSVAAAGNDGDATFSYPASYDSVVSVAAVDADEAVTDFSQYNAQVEVAAPGKHVLSTVSYFAEGKVSVSGTDYVGKAFPEAATGTASGPLVSAGLCDVAPKGKNRNVYKGMIVLCQRGTITFAEKVQNAVKGGAAAVAVYNNVPEGFSGTLGDYAAPVPAVTLSGDDGGILVANELGNTATVATAFIADQSEYAYYDGTSMATPHVSGVAALVWSRNPSVSSAEIRRALRDSAVHPGTDPLAIDDYYGYGIIKALKADAYFSGPCASGCDDSDPCTYDRCNVADGSCTHPAIPACGAAPSPVIDTVTPDSGKQNQSLSVVIEGSNFSGGTITFGDGISIVSAVLDSSSSITCKIKIDRKAALGARTIILDMGGQQATATFTVLAK